MDKYEMREMTIRDIKELVEGKKVKAHLISAMLIEPMNAVICTFLLAMMLKQKKIQ